MSVTGTKEAALLKLQKYCAYQERCHSEVRDKLFKLKIYGSDQDEIILSLIEEDFLNEERYARSYARGKFRMNHWGKVKIAQGLKAKQISEYCVNAGLSEIDDEEYLQVLTDLADKLREKSPAKNDFEQKQKVIQALLRKGFEYGMIREVLDEKR